ncbi:hypothetical protein V9T40_011858 [Parthenolecanium corni]|uniref:Uncharacterized protein n=1 Tax=Parthenolecanium corni TaxID=536013 RepID=A0AAN9T634_9HEMI
MALLRPPVPFRLYMYVLCSMWGAKKIRRIRLQRHLQAAAPAFPCVRPSRRAHIFGAPFTAAPNQRHEEAAKVVRRRLRRRHRRVSAALIVPSPSHPGGQPLRCQPFRSYRSSTPRSPPTSSDLPFLPLRRTEKRTAAFLAGIDALPAGPVHFSRLPRVATFPHALVSRYIAPAFPSNPPPFRHCHCAIFPASLLAIGEARESEVDSPATLERFPPSRRLFHSFYTARGVCVSGTCCGGDGGGGGGVSATVASSFFKT